MFNKTSIVMLIQSFSGSHGSKSNKKQAFLKNWSLKNEICEAAQIPAAEMACLYKRCIFLREQ